MLLLVDVACGGVPARMRRACWFDTTAIVSECGVKPERSAWAAGAVSLGAAVDALGCARIATLAMALPDAGGVPGGR
ncbi:hypothetical protein ACQUJS_06440 [Ralstonia pseudosolanacearum]|nr:hypothetical protein RSP799_14700 [Ralstonia solanacearum]